MKNKEKLMHSFKVLAVVLAFVGFAGVASAAVNLTDTINPQNCSRTDATCAKFVDTTSEGQIKWGAFIAGGLRSLTNLFVDGKMAIGSLIVSNGQQPLRLDVNGAIGAKYYCDDNGNNCVAGNALGGGSNSGLISLTLNSGNGITVSPNTFNSSNTTGVISIDANYTQRRISGTCTGSNAIKQINADGTVVCQATGTGTGSVNLKPGLGIAMSPNPITSDGLISADFNIIQHRLTAACPAGQAIQGIDGNGKATCISTSGTGTGIVIPNGVAGQTLRFSGVNTLGVSSVLYDDGSNIGIGTANPTSKLDVNGKVTVGSLKIGSNSTAGQVLTAIDANGNATWQNPSSLPGDLSSNFKIVRKTSHQISGWLTVSAVCPVGYTVMACSGTLSNCEEDSCGYHGARRNADNPRACNAYFDTVDSGISNANAVAYCVKGSAISETVN